MTQTHGTNSGQTSTWSLIRLVAGREIKVRGGSRSFKISTALTVLMVVALVAVPTFFDDDGPTEWELGVIGEVPSGFEATLELAAASQGATITIVHLPADADADEVAESADHDAVLVDGTELVATDTPSDGLTAAVNVALAQSRLIDQLVDAGLDADEAAEALAVEPVEVRAPGAAAGEDDGDGLAEAIAFIGVVALFIAINSYGVWVLTGVLEEKSSRVVELIVAAIPARTLLVGKVVGIGLLGLGQLVLIAVVGLGTAVAMDVTEVPLDLLPALGSIVGWFILGFAFYAVAYAAAGSLVTRQEDAQSAASPLAYAMIAAYLVSLAVVSPNPEGLAAKILSFVPFIAPMAMPSRIAQGAAAPWEIVGSVVAMLIGIWLMASLAARIYERSLLRGGARVKFWAAIRELLAERRAGAIARSA